VTQDEGPITKPRKTHSKGAPRPKGIPRHVDGAEVQFSRRARGRTMAPSRGRRRNFDARYFFLVAAAVVLLALLRPSYFGSLAGTDKFLLFRLPMSWPSFASALTWRTVLNAEGSRCQRDRLDLGVSAMERPPLRLRCHSLSRLSPARLWLGRNAGLR
jgi:hypothetical protein